MHLQPYYFLLLCRLTCCVTYKLPTVYVATVRVTIFLTSCHYSFMVHVVSFWIFVQHAELPVLCCFLCAFARCGSTNCFLLVKKPILPAKASTVFTCTNHEKHSKIALSLLQKEGLTIWQLIYLLISHASFLLSKIFQRLQIKPCRQKLLGSVCTLCTNAREEC